MKKQRKTRPGTCPVCGNGYIVHTDGKNKCSLCGSKAKWNGRELVEFEKHENYNKVNAVRAYESLERG